MSEADFGAPFTIGEHSCISLNTSAAPPLVFLLVFQILLLIHAIFLTEESTRYVYFFWGTRYNLIVSSFPSGDVVKCIQYADLEVNTFCMLGARMRLP